MNFLQMTSQVSHNNLSLLPQEKSSPSNPKSQTTSKTKSALSLKDISTQELIDTQQSSKPMNLNSELKIISTTRIKSLNSKVKIQAVKNHNLYRNSSRKTSIQWVCKSRSTTKMPPPPQNTATNQSSEQTQASKSVNSVTMPGKALTRYSQEWARYKRKSVSTTDKPILPQFISQNMKCPIFITTKTAKVKVDPNLQILVQKKCLSLKVRTQTQKWPIKKAIKVVILRRKWW